MEVLVALTILAVACAVLATSQAFHARLLRGLADDAGAIARLRDEVEALRIASPTSACATDEASDASGVVCAVAPTACPLPDPDCELVVAAGLQFVEVVARGPNGGSARVRLPSSAPLRSDIVAGR